jgi:oligopeptide/dipeptide ABC transporter ATP-binding protein
LATDVALSVDRLDLGTRAADGSATDIVSDVSFTVRRGECLGLVGESGSGKSLTLRAVLGLLPNGVMATSGTIHVAGDTGTTDATAQTVRHGRVGMVFQEPMTALNPSMRIGTFLEKTIRMHQPLGRAAARRHAEALLGDLGVPDPRQKLRAWPHELSGGLRQRIVIAAALASEPDVLLCDEPTTALDVTVQDQILGLLDEIRVERDVGMVFVTHDLGVVAQVAQRVAVMYAGRFMETGPIGPVFQRPEHPYTDGLLGAMPDVADDVEELTTIPGSLPPVGSPPPGCRFAPRCRYADTACEVIDGALIALPEGRATACIAPERMHEDRH